VRLGLSPQPEPAPARQQRSNSSQTHGAEWAAHCRQYADAAVARLRREMKAQQDKQLANLAEAMGRVVAEERARHRDEMDALKAEIDKLKASDEHVIDMSRHIGRRRDAA
jgi:hypothetical protein